MNRFLTVLFCTLILQAFAQTSEKYNSEYENFYRAEELFQKEQFAAARYEFRTFMDGFTHKNDPLYIKAAFYEGVSALELYNNDAVNLLEDFLKNYPESIYTHQIYFRLGRYFYQKKNYKEALAWFNKLGSKDVEPEDREEFFFKLGYSNFELDRFVPARNAFHEVKDGASQYAAPALYYYSHIAYMDGSYQVALEGFKKLQDDERFAKTVPYYIAQIYHRQGDYRAVVDYVPYLLDTVAVANKNDLNHIIGNSYFRLKMYDEAVPYLEAYNTRSKTTRHDDYELGYAYYRSNQYTKAIRMFDKVTKGKDSLAQYAYYHIGESYQRSNELLPARSAFKAASEINADNKVQEDALYNFAVLSYKLDLNPYDEAVIALEMFLQKYPDSQRKNDVYQYLVNVYTSTNNHVKALASLDKLPNKDAKLKMAYQLVAYNYGVELYQKKKYKEAIETFELVERYPVDAAISGRARFWTADAWFQLNNMDKAIKFYKEFLAMPATNASDLKADAYYNIGYAYLNKEDISLSLDAFRIYVQSNVKDKRKLADAYMRVGDGHYMLKQNEQAITNYQEALKLNVGYQDQALYYIARAYGFSGKSDLKIKNLLDLINNYTGSKYIITSVYEVALTYKAKSDFTNAYKYFNQVVNDYPNVSFAIDSKIEIADIYFKKGEFGKSESEYNKILQQHSADRSVCERATRGLIDIYAALKQPEKAVALASKYSCTNLSSDEEENLYYTPAIEAYIDSLYAAAIPNFEKYLQKYPNGKFSAESKIFLANSYYAIDNKVKAIDTYKWALEGPNNSYTEFAAGRVAQYAYNNGIYDQALIYYDRLEKVASKPSVVFNAKLGLMRCHFLLGNWTSAMIYSKEVLSSSQINNTLRMEAEYAKGMSAFTVENYNEAKPSLEWIIKNTTTAMAAEARFTLAEMYFKLSDLNRADEEIRNLLKMKPSYNFWVAKGLILQTRILIIKDDLFQAEQTLKSVIDHYPDQNDGVLMEANELWDELMQLKNRTKRVDTKGENVIDLNNGN